MPKHARSLTYGSWNERTRVYDIPGVPYPLPSVTSIIGMKDKPALVTWAGNMAAEYAIEHRDALASLEPEAAVAAVKGAWRRKRDKAANFGTAVHLAIETGETPPEDDPRAGYVRGSIRALNDLGVDVTHQELEFVSMQHNYAGTADVVGTNLNGRVILDWKSGKGLYPEAAMQLVALMNADHVIVDDEMIPFEFSDVGYAVRLTPGKWYQETILRESEAGERAMDSFLGLIPVWHFTTTTGKAWDTHE